MTDEQPSTAQKIWLKIKAAVAWVGTKMLGPIIALVVIIVAGILIFIGFRHLQIGGFLGRLLGKKGGDDPNGGKTIELANSVDKDRIGPDGKLIEPGKSDSVGDTQAVVVPIEKTGLFSDPKKVVFTPPNTDKPVEVTLPDGVTNKDVHQVVIVKPNVVAVTVKDTSGISTQTVDDLLKKYDK